MLKCGRCDGHAPIRLAGIYRAAARPLFGYLVIAHAPAGIREDPAALMKLLIERLQPERDFALGCEQAGSETVLFHCSIDKATVEATGRKPLP